MKLQNLASLVLGVIAVSVVGCSKESSAIAAGKPADTSKTTMSTPATATAPAPMPNTPTPAPSGAMPTASEPSPSVPMPAANVMGANSHASASRTRYLTSQPPVFPSEIAPTPVVPAASGELAAETEPPTPEPTGPDPRADLKTMIPEMIQLIEAKDYVTMFKKMTPPSKFVALPPRADINVIAQAATKDPSFDAAMVEFQEELKAIKDNTPTMDDTGTKATFPLNPPIGEDDEVDFVKENGLWYPGG